MFTRIRLDMALSDAQRLAKLLAGQVDYLTAMILAAEAHGDTDSDYYYELLLNRNVAERTRQGISESQQLNIAARIAAQARG